MYKNIRQWAAKIIHSNKFLNVYYYTFFRIAILNRFQDDQLGIFKVRNFHKKSPEETILKGYTYKSKTQDNTIVTVPDLNLYLFENALINSRSSAVVSGTIVYYEAINRNERFSGNFVKHHNTKNAIVRLGEPEIINEGFFLAGSGSFNWYHWLIEILPKMLFYKCEYSSKILVDESCRTIPSMAETLKKFSEKFELEIIYLNADKTYVVQNLYFINEVNKLMYNAIDNNLEIFPIYYYRQESLKQLRDKFLKNWSEEKEHSEKVYLGRKNTHRIAANEHYVIESLQEMGFVNVDLVGLTIREQISIFNNAAAVIGTTGAAWTNLLFCKPHTKCIIFMPNNYKTYKFYAELADMMEVEVNYLYYENDSESHEKSDFIINLNELENLLVKNE